MSSTCSRAVRRNLSSTSALRNTEVTEGARTPINMLSSQSMDSSANASAVVLPIAPRREGAVPVLA
eukprot:8353329-Karenia_brevis.AAC.1